MNWLLLILVLAYPGLHVKPQWYAQLRRADVHGHYAPMPDDPDKIGWYVEGTNEMGVIWTQDGPEMIRRLSHETMHYLADDAKLGNWDLFAKLALKRMRRGDLNRHQVASIKGMLAYGGGHELHAELPRILEGHLSCEFAPWYPWFELGCEKEKEAKHR